MMALIFAFSATPGKNLPDLGLWDRLFKKGGHMAGYGMLAVSYWHALGWKPQRAWLAWLLALLYAASDELHQSLTPGRFPSLQDVLLFDNLGAALGLLLAGWVKKKMGF